MSAGFTKNIYFYFRSDSAAIASIRSCHKKLSDHGMNSEYLRLRLVPVFHHFILPGNGVLMGKIYIYKIRVSKYYIKVTSASCGPSNSSVKHAHIGDFSFTYLLGNSELFNF